MLKMVYFSQINRVLAAIFILPLATSTLQAEINPSLLDKRDSAQWKGRKEVAALNKDLKEHVHKKFMYVLAYCSSKAHALIQDQPESMYGLYYYNHARDLLGRETASHPKEIDHKWLQEIYDEAALFEWIESGSYKLPSPAQTKLFEEAMQKVRLNMPLLIAASDLSQRGNEDFLESRVMIHNTPGSMVARPAILFSSDPDKELWQAIVYHEIGHLKNNDLLKSYSLGLYNGKNGINYELLSPDEDDSHKKLIKHFIDKGISLLPIIASTHIGQALAQEIALPECQKALKKKGRLWSSFSDEEYETEIVYARKIEELADLFCLKTLLENGQFSIAFRYIQNYALHLLRRSVESSNEEMIAYSIAFEHDPHPSDTERALYGLGFLAEHLPNLPDQLRDWERQALCEPIESMSNRNSTSRVNLSYGAQDVRKAYENPPMPILWQKQISLDTYNKSFIEHILYLLEKIEHLLDKDVKRAHYYYTTLRNRLGKKETSARIDREWLLEVKKEADYLKILEALKANPPTPLEEKLVWDSARVLHLKSTPSFIAGNTKEALHTAGFFEVTGKHQKGLFIATHDDLDIHLMGLYTQLGILEDNTDVKIGHVFLVPDLYKGLLMSSTYQESIQKMSRYFTLGLKALPTIATTIIGAAILKRLAIPEAQFALANNAASLYIPSSSDQDMDALMQITRSLEQKTILYALENLWQQRGSTALLSVMLFFARGESADRPLVISQDKENISAIELALYILGFLVEHTPDLHKEVLDWQTKGHCYPSRDTNPAKNLEADFEVYQKLSKGAQDLRYAFQTYANLPK